MNLDMARNMADPVSDQLVKLFFDYAGLAYMSLLFTTDWEEIEKKFPQLSEAISKFRNSTESPLLPGELKVLKKANAFYQNNKQYIFLSLGFLSLPYCYAAESGVKVLYLSEKFRNRTKERLLETSAFVEKAVQLADPDMGKESVSAIQKVRLGHSVFRYHVQSKMNENMGLAINQEDMAGTNLAFSLLVLRGLRKMGIKTNAADIETWIQAWNIIGQRLGLDESMRPTDANQAFLLSQKIEERHFRTSSEGLDLTKKLLNFYEELLPEPKKLSGFMSYMLGKKTAEILGLISVSDSDFEKLKWRAFAFLASGNINLTRYSK